MEDMGGSVLVYLYDASGSPIGMQYRNRIYDMGAYDNFWFEKNLQGDIVAVYDEDGTKLISYTYDAWGNFTTTYHNGCTASYIANRNPFRYRGYYYDVETGLYYLQSRYYDPVIGRFINADNNFSNNNLFVYCANNPVNAIDPDGHHWYYLWVDDIFQSVKDLLACSSNVVFGKAAQKKAYYDPQGAVELWRSRPFQDVETSKEMQIFTEFMYDHDFVVDASITFDLPVENAYFKIGISELLSANKNMNSTYFHIGGGSSYSFSPPVSVSYSVGLVKGVNNKMDYARDFMDIGCVAGVGVDYCWWNSSALCLTVSNSIGVYAGYDFYWCLD